MPRDAAESAARGPREAGATPRRALRPERAFAALAVVFGAAFGILTPPLQAPDEIRHLLRAHAIAEGQLLARAQPGRHAYVEVPRDLLELETRLGAAPIRRHPERVQDPERLRRELARPIDAAPRVPVRMPSLYSPVPYAPQALAIAAVGAWGGSAVACVWAGRLANLALYTVLVWWALRRAPAHRWTLLLLATTPMALFEAAALGADAPSNAFAFLLVALVLRAGVGRGTLSGREIAGLAVVAALLGLCKQAYAPLALLALAIPGRRFADPGRRAAAVCAVAAAGLLPAGLWFAALQGLDLAPLVRGADPDAQMRFVLAHPWRTLEIFGATLERTFPVYVRTFVGYLGHVDTPLPGAVYWLHPLLLVGVSVWDGGRRSPVGAGARLVLVAVAALSWLATMLLAYVGWNRPGDEIVRYVQGRYFIPFATLLFLALHHPRSPGLPAAAGWAAAAASAAVLAVAVAAVAGRYWLA